MKKYAQVLNGKVVAVCDSPNTMIEILVNDSRLLGTTYDEVTQSFIGYKTVLTVDKPQITANGVDSATITATVYNWDDTVATAYADDIAFEVNGASQLATPTNGIATLPITASVPDDYVIKTVNVDAYMMSNGSVTVVAV